MLYDDDEWWHHVSACFLDDDYYVPTMIDGLGSEHGCGLLTNVLFLFTHTVSYFRILPLLVGCTGPTGFPISV